MSRGSIWDQNTAIGRYDQNVYGGNVTTATELRISNETITAEDIAKFKKLLGFMEFAMSASEELRNLMVAYEAKQRILK